MIPNDRIVVLSFVGGLRLDFVVVADDGVGEDSGSSPQPPPRWRMRTCGVCPVQVEARVHVADGLDENCRWNDVAVDRASTRKNDKITELLTKRCDAWVWHELLIRLRRFEPFVCQPRDDDDDESVMR